MLIFNDVEGVENIVILMLREAADKLYADVANYLGLTNEQLASAALALGRELEKADKKNRKVALSVWHMGTKTEVASDAIALAARAKKRIKDFKIIVQCVIACQDILEASSQRYRGNLIMCAANFGGAKARFENYISRARSASIGAGVRAEGYDQIERTVVAIWESECDLSMPADKAAEDIIGRVKLSHRKIADIIRKAKKSRRNA